MFADIGVLVVLVQAGLYMSVYRRQNNANDTYTLRDATRTYIYVYLKMCLLECAAVAEAFVSNGAARRAIDSERVSKCTTSCVVV